MQRRNTPPPAVSISSNAVSILKVVLLLLLNCIDKVLIVFTSPGKVVIRPAVIHHNWDSCRNNIGKNQHSVPVLFEINYKYILSDMLHQALTPCTMQVPPLCQLRYQHRWCSVLLYSVTYSFHDLSVFMSCDIISGSHSSHYHVFPDRPTLTVLFLFIAPLLIHVPSTFLYFSNNPISLMRILWPTPTRGNQIVSDEMLSVCNAMLYQALISMSLKYSSFWIAN